jgi:hypothetical protein
MIDLDFRRWGPDFARLATAGSTPEIVGVIRRTVDRAVVWVAAIYILLLSIAFLGAVKP